jgi:formate hydrogenlyase subunit 3/multisubunit Na+/H+ antiporter MnhD subunit
MRPPVAPTSTGNPAPMTESVWVVVPVALPLAVGTACYLLGGGAARRLTLPFLAATLAATVWLVDGVSSAGPLGHALGGWGAPLGIELAADGLASLMLCLTAAVYAGVLVYALHYFAADSREATAFWPLAWLLWGSLNALFLSRDLFNLYVTLELVGLAAVGLTALAGTAAALAAALRYLLAALLGSGAYLLAVALLYGATGALSLPLVAAALTASPVAWTAGALLALGLALKTALFPLHSWLPPAHGGAVSPVSALLSALVIKASFYLLLRLWLTAPATLASPAAGALLGLLGSAAILWGSIGALVQSRLKMLIAYSTVAQIGYLFLVFALLAGPGAAAGLEGAVIQVLAHGLAKAAMFLSAGTLMLAAGSDELARVAGAIGRLPLTLTSFGLAGITIMGLPPSAGFVAKWQLAQAALAAGRWWWVVVLVAGGLLAAAYVFRVLRLGFAPSDPNAEAQPVPRALELPAFALAVASVALGLASGPLGALLDAPGLLGMRRP